MNYEDAKSNCANKMARYGKGRLFEPKSYNMSEIVSAKAHEIFKGGYFWIGINDIDQQYTYVYESKIKQMSDFYLLIFLNFQH